MAKSMAYYSVYYALSECASKYPHLNYYILLSVAENSHLLHMGKYHCTADLLFDWLGLSLC